MAISSDIEKFRNETDNRYWWYRSSGARYIPPVLRCLCADEWDIMRDWYRDSGEKFVAGECAIPPISALFGFITGSNVRRLVQLGHYTGFSTLLLGFTLRSMENRRGLFSIDIDPRVTEYTDSWIKRAGLDDYVKLTVNDSSASAAVDEACQYLGGAPQLIFIDSSHQYAHTRKELDLWYPALVPGGLIFMHDASRFAEQFDPGRQGGVRKGLNEWLAATRNHCLTINEGCDGNQSALELSYQDPCGLAIIQKPIA